MESARSKRTLISERLVMFQLCARVATPLARNVHVKAMGYKYQSKAVLYDMIAMHQKKMLRKHALHFNANLQVLGSGSLGVPACVCLTTTTVNYLFNCGESTQRLSQEYRCKLSKLSNIFLTQLSWKNMGGLAGLLLTAQDNGLREVNVHCPQGLESYIEAIKTFIHLTNLKVTCMPVDERDHYEDGVMKVSYVPLVRSLLDDEAEEERKVEKEERIKTNVSGKRTVEEEEEEKGQARKRSKIIPRVVCYVCQIHPRPGKLSLHKCIDFGIKPGPFLRMLKEGLDVTKDDGTVVRSKDVCGSNSPKATFIVVECPTEEYLDSLTCETAFLKYQHTAEEEDKPLCVFHFTPEKIITDERYQNWMKRFSSKTEHVILNEENTCVGSAAVYKNQYILNMLHPEIFPLLNSNEFVEDKKTGNEYTHRGRVCDLIKLRPEPERLTKTNVFQTAETYLDEIRKIPDFAETFEKLKENIEKMSAELNLESISDYPRIVMLGTGCSVPNKVRNTSGILVRITEHSSIVLDCGEGTLGQIIRFYGITKAKKILRTIKAIYVSHMHADHHMGLIGLLLYRKQLTKDSLFLLVPKSMTAWLNFYNDHFERICDQYEIVKNNDVYQNFHSLPAVVESVLYNSLNVKSIDTTYVAHCSMAYGIAITFKDGKKIVYSGDTMFSQNLVNLGKDCDMLIHEATMENGLEKLAKRKLHSTTSEAIKAGKFMDAKFVLLTHFSQRYSKIPSIPDNETNVGLAYDNMELKLPQLPLLPLFYPCIKVMFQEYSKVLE